MSTWLTKSNNFSSGCLNLNILNRITTSKSWQVQRREFAFKTNEKRYGPHQLH